MSTHVYANDTAKDVFGTDVSVPRDRMVCLAVRKVYEQVKSSLRPDLPIEWTEYNASYKNETEVTDSAYMGPWLAKTISECDGMLDNLSYWTFSDVFDEQGVIKQPFYGGFGLIAERGIAKPAFNTFEVLHNLGTERVKTDSDDVLVTRRADGTLAIAVWNYFPPAKKGTSKRLTLRFRGFVKDSRHQAKIQHAHSGSESESVLELYEQMGSPKNPTMQQLQALRQAAKLPPPETRDFTGNELQLTLPPYCLALIEIR